MPDGRTSFQIDLAKIYKLLTPAFGGGGDSGQPDPDNPLKPGPWDPVIRVALKDVLRFGPDPIPWRFAALSQRWAVTLLGAELAAVVSRRFPAVWDAIGGGGLGDEVALNPQPLPPRAIFIVALGEALVARAEALAEVASAFSGGDTAADERGIIIVSGYVGRLVDEYCGTGFRLRWPFPGPPPQWFRGEVGAQDLLMLGAGLHGAAEQAFDPAAQRALGEASAKLAQAGIERLG